jgi:hypothetical protein
MSFKNKVILTVLITSLSILLIQSLPLFAKARDCYCIDYNEADYSCIEFCNLYGESCDFAMLTLENYCSYEDCVVKWRIYCSGNINFYYWQSNENCFRYCQWI